MIIRIRKFIFNEYFIQIKNHCHYKLILCYYLMGLNLFRKFILSIAESLHTNSSIEIFLNRIYLLIKWKYFNY